MDITITVNSFTSHQLSKLREVSLDDIRCACSRYRVCSLVALIALRKNRDERKALISGQYNKAETTGKSSVTIGHFELSDETPTTQAEDGFTVVHYQIPMSKMSLVSLIILSQMSSYHAINFFSLRKSEV